MNRRKFIKNFLFSLVSVGLPIDLNGILEVGNSEGLGRGSGLIVDNFTFTIPEYLYTREIKFCIQKELNNE